MRFLDETTALGHIQSLLRAATHAKLAVAFWGKGAIERLGLDRDDLRLEILCNLDSGACNPAELRKIYNRPGVTLRSHPSLHAKIYWTSTGAVLGSSNASANGLAVEGKEAAAWHEANIAVDDPDLLTEINTWITGHFAEGYDIEEEDLTRAEKIWKTRKRMSPPGKRLAHSLFEAYRTSPEHPAWKRVKIAFCMDDLDQPDEEWLKTEIDAGRLPPGILAYSDWNELILPGYWVIDVFVGKRAAKYNGIMRAASWDTGNPKLRLVEEKDSVGLGAFGSLQLSEEEVKQMEAIAREVLALHSEDDRNALISIATAVALIDAQQGPSIREFDRAMRSIYDEATTFGYFPTTFLQMLGKHGSVETARRLVRTKTTSGFSKLWENGRLDLSVEALIIQRKWSGLFTTEELRIAKRRLRQFEYEPNDG